MIPTWPALPPLSPTTGQTNPLVNVGGLYIVSMLSLPLWYLPQLSCIPCSGSFSLRGWLSPAPYCTWIYWRKSFRETMILGAQERVSVISSPLGKCCWVGEPMGKFLCGGGGVWDPPPQRVNLSTLSSRLTIIHGPLPP